ncbi:MAG: hypothetical protein ACEQSC_00170 [Candidatus Nanopelagicaceae bacterium]
MIDLDPASCISANKTIEAKVIITRKLDSFSIPWAYPHRPVSIYLNPPGGKTGSKSNVQLFWDKLMATRDSGLLEHAIFMGFSLENLQVTQGGESKLSICDFPVVIPSKRIKFISPDGQFNSPTHSNVIAYIPGLTNNTGLFKEVFSPIGAIMYPG